MGKQETEEPKQKRVRKSNASSPLALAEHVYKTTLAWSDAELAQFERVLAALRGS
jgi:hypothetical protein